MQVGPQASYSNASQFSHCIDISTTFLCVLDETTPILHSQPQLSHLSLSEAHAFTNTSALSLLSIYPSVALILHMWQTFMAGLEPLLTQD